MSKMKELSIELQNSLKGTIEYRKGMTRDEFDIKMHEDYHRIVSQSGMPLWVWEEYKTDITQRYYEDSDKAMRMEGIESPSLSRQISADTPQSIKDRVNDHGDSLLAEYNKLNDLNTTELEQLLNVENFKQSGKGEDYYAQYGNWEDAYDQHLYDLGYYKSLDPQ